MRPGTLARWYAIRKILKSEIKETSVVIDIGGYDGFVLSKLSSQIKGIKSVILDLDSKGLEIAKERGLASVCGSAFKLPIKDESCDVVMCMSVIEHVDEDEELVAEISRVLKPGGKLLLTTPGKKGVRILFLTRKANDLLEEGWGHVRKGYSLGALSNMFGKNRLMVQRRVGYFNLLTRFFYRVCFYSRLPVPGREKLFKYIVKFEPFLKLGANTHLVIAKKI